MSKCNHPECETKEALPFKCNYCQKLFCTKHRLPENHNCENLHLAKERAFRKQKQEIIPETKVISKREERKQKRQEKRMRTEVVYDPSDDHYYATGPDGQLYSVKTKGKGKDSIFLSQIADSFTSGWEILDIVICSVIILLSFGFTSIFMSNIPWLYLVFIAPIIIFAYIMTFIPRKLMIKKFGYSSRYVLTKIGLLITVVTIISPIKFIFPGLLVIPESQYLTKKEHGISGAIGPIINTILGIGFILLGWLLPNPLVGIIFTVGAFITSQLTIIYILPFRGTSGKKLLEWSWVLFAILIVFNLAIIIGCCFMGVLGI